MHLTLYTDYTLRVMMYLALKYPGGGVSTIDEIAGAYGISRNHLTKIVHGLSQVGFIETSRGRAGGACLARAPEQISVGEIVRAAEKDFAVVRCQDMTVAHGCTIFPACNLRHRLYRAVDAFLHELDTMTLREAIAAPTVAATVLGMADPRELVSVAVSRPRGSTSRRTGGQQ
ncbi:BadM/Rrf2 family transcriptional regulator [Burkholderia pyrrocinia]|uniref:BadM/Rrf2 family transcriptional regulator n=1 Tax=Burkholderia pyrrocinia TaxID=60550 RepID=A0A2Z5N348_BURPY|nr:Rrf2 family transcriptional regulator [Burkholderia pyrrocinia]AXF23955.1 BadM/Rrf2 family transcriptional regulator [Burkholderia pyrrocinia]